MEKGPAYALCAAKSDAEKAAIYRFRFDVFGREMGLLGPVENWQEPSFSDPMDEHSHHIYADTGDAIIGAIRTTSGTACTHSAEFLETYELAPFLDVLAPEQVAVVTRLMVSSEQRGSLLSLHLVKQTAEYCLEQGVECVFIDCQPHLVPFYQRYGFRSYRTVFNDPYVGVLVPLVLIISDTDHLAQVRSPFFKIITRQREPNPELAQTLSALIHHAPSIVTEEIHGDDFFQEAINHHLENTTDPDEDWGVLEGLSTEDINTLTHGSYLMNCKQGDVIIHTNHATRTMFLVIEGTLECQQEGKTLGFVNKGDVVGEFAYLTNAPRTADVTVVSEVASVLAFEIKHMNRLIESHPRLAARCLLNLSRSLCMKFINQV